MNYEKLYLKFCSEYQKTTPKERLLKRNGLDRRLQKPKIYTEIHHILPISLGGTDDPVNLVVLLPEEHLFLHRLRYKAYGDREDFLAIRFIINGFIGKLNLEIVDDFSKKFNISYGWFKQNCYEFRKTKGWQTGEGKKSISNHRKGKIPGRCSKTGVILGEFSVDDIRVISGEIVHHSKGWHSYYDPVTNEKIFCRVEEKPDNFIANRGDISGVKNPKYSNITDDEIFEFTKRLSIVLRDSFNEIETPSLNLITGVWNMVDKRKFPNLGGGLKSGFRFRGDIKNLFVPISEQTGLKLSRSSKMLCRLTIEEITDAYNRIYR